MKLLRQIIEEKGHVTIAQFMEIAMYDSVNGYYLTQEPIGKDADFITAPEVSQLFGEIIGIYCLEKWMELGSPKKFNLIELGPGRATLMLDLIRATKHVKAFAKALQIHLVDTNIRLVEVQRQRLKEYSPTWHKDISTIPTNEPMIIIANEFFDCLPINRYIKRKNDWYEQVVSLMPKEGDFCFSYLPTLALFNETMNLEHPNAKDGAIVEICYPAQKLIRDFADKFAQQNGVMLIIDYGYDLDSLNRVAYNGSLQAVKEHKFHPVLNNIGRADITAHVDFFELKKTAIANFCFCSETITQGEFLKKYGINLRAKMLKKMQAQNNQLKLI